MKRSRRTHHKPSINSLRELLAALAYGLFLEASLALLVHSGVRAAEQIQQAQEGALAQGFGVALIMGLTLTPASRYLVLFHLIKLYGLGILQLRIIDLLKAICCRHVLYGVIWLSSTYLVHMSVAKLHSWFEHQHPHQSIGKAAGTHRLPSTGSSTTP